VLPFSADIYELATFDHLMKRNHFSKKKREKLINHKNASSTNYTTGRAGAGDG